MPPVAPPTPFAGGYRGASKPNNRRNPGCGGDDDDDDEDDDFDDGNDDGSVKAAGRPLERGNPSTCESSPSPIPICPPPPKDLLLPTSTSAVSSSQHGKPDDVEEEVALADELATDYADVDVSIGKKSQNDQPEGETVGDRKLEIN